MELIIGGAFQGKLQYAKTKYGFSVEDICDCKKDPIRFSAPCIYHWEQLVLSMITEGKDAVKELSTHWEELSGSVIICEDISCGVVPMDAVQREWREQNGRLLGLLAQQATSVTRIFCGLSQELKK